MNISIKNCYILTKKFNDLKNLCIKKNISNKYHVECLKLKHSTLIKDVLNESNRE